MAEQEMDLGPGGRLNTRLGFEPDRDYANLTDLRIGRGVHDTVISLSWEDVLELRRAVQELVVRGPRG